MGSDAVLPRLLAVTPPVGSLSAARVDLWRQAGLLVKMGLLLRPGPREFRAGRIPERLQPLHDAMLAAGRPSWLSLSPAQLQSPNDLYRYENKGLYGIHLKSGWREVEFTTWLRAAGDHGLRVGLSGHVDDPPPGELAPAYRSFAPVFTPRTADPTRTKTGVGLEALERYVRQSDAPVFALGGVAPERVAACIDAGAWGVAAIRDFFGPEEGLTQYARALSVALDRRVSPLSTR